jgi:hypothetical protein
MSEENAKPVGKVKVPGLEPVPYVVVKLPDGTTALRRPEELKKR